MPKEIYQCQCSHCEQQDKHPVQLEHRQINLLISHLNEQQRRWYVALESLKKGRSGIELMHQIMRMDQKTIWRGRSELESELEDRPHDRVRLSGGGRNSLEKNT